MRGNESIGEVEKWKLFKGLLDRGLLRKEYMSERDEILFVRNLERRHMSDWTKEEMALYNDLTGQGNG